MGGALLPSIHELIRERARAAYPQEKKYYVHYVLDTMPMPFEYSIQNQKSSMCSGAEYSSLLVA